MFYLLKELQIQENQSSAKDSWKFFHVKNTFLNKVLALKLIIEKWPLMIGQNTKHLLFFLKKELMKITLKVDILAIQKYSLKEEAKLCN